METTDNHTPTPEELTLCIEESAVRAADACEQSPAVLRVDGSVIGTLGNFSASIGKAKSKKTFNVAALTAAALTNGTVLHYRASFPEEKRGILYIDTEQGRPHCQQVLRRILREEELHKSDTEQDKEQLVPEETSKEEVSAPEAGIGEKEAKTQGEPEKTDGNA